MGCSAPRIIVGGVEMSTNDFENAKELLETVSGDNGDPTMDGVEESIASGNNTKGTTGVQLGAPTAPVQTSPPPAIDVPADATDNKQSAPKVGTTISTSSWPWVLNGVAGDINAPCSETINGSTVQYATGYDKPLSDNFKIRHFSVNAVFKNQITDITGLTKEARCTNLLNLANNVAEVIRAKFGQFNINSAIRNQNSVPNGISQHVSGSAMDIQFPGWTYDMYWQNAPWVRDNVPYDQFIFEHSDKSGKAWYHLSYKGAGNRTQVLTMYRNKYSPGLHRFY